MAELDKIECVPCKHDFDKLLKGRVLLKDGSLKYFATRCFMGSHISWTICILRELADELEKIEKEDGK